MLAAFFIGLIKPEVLMKVVADYALMQDIEDRYKDSTGLRSRDHYSIFYGPLLRSRLLVINANPGGTPENYKIVDVMKGEHEYIEGRASGPTTANGAQILQHIVRNGNPQSLRSIQVLNRFFRRSPQRPNLRTEMEYMAEARPFIAELINYIQPDALLFGGDSGVALMARAHGATLKEGNAIMGPNGTNDAVYFREYELRLPYYKPVMAYGIYHPSKLNGVFREKVFPLLVERLGPLIGG
jgi:hypothetical protein